MDEELRPCPFCGGQVQPVRSDPTYGISGIFCRGCKAMVRWDLEMAPDEKYGENMKKWQNRWNRRANG